MVELELDRDPLHQPLEREVELRPAESADQARRHLVGQHDAVGHVDIGNVVGSGQRAVHAVERAGHGRAQERAVIFELIEPQRQDAAVLGDRGFDLGDAVGARACSQQMLEPVLHPFDRPAGDARRDRRQHDIGKDRQLDAEASAAVRRDAQAQLRSGHAQRPRHHRMGAERTLKVGQHVVAAVARPVFGDDDVAFHRRERVARIFAGERDAGIGLLERALGVAVGKFAHRDLVGLRLRVQHRRRFAAGGERIDHRLQRLIVDAHQVGRVLREIAGVRHDQGDRLADIAHALDRQRPLIDRRLERDQERIGQRADVLARHDSPDAVLRQRLGRVDADNLGVRVRGANDVSVQRSRRNRQVIGIAPSPRQQGGIFLAKDRNAQKSGHYYLTTSLQSADDVGHPGPTFVPRRSTPE